MPMSSIEVYSPGLDPWCSSKPTTGDGFASNMRIVTVRADAESTDASETRATAEAVTRTSRCFERGVRMTSPEAVSCGRIPSDSRRRRSRPACPPRACQRLVAALQCGRRSRPPSSCPHAGFLRPPQGSGGTEFPKVGTALPPLAGASDTRRVTSPSKSATCRKPGERHGNCCIYGSGLLAACWSPENGSRGEHFGGPCPRFFELFRGFFLYFTQVRV